MSIIWWLVFGLIAGFIASKIVNAQGEGVLLDIVLGITGAVIGGLIFNSLGEPGVTGLDAWSFVVATFRAPSNEGAYAKSAIENVPTHERQNQESSGGLKPSRRTRRAAQRRSRTLSLSRGSATTHMGWSLSFLTTSSAPGSITPGTVTCTASA
jgi:uncharacterized membrane protein YeaQ/YmgE (transglycosylase-associated protein family)